MCPCSAFNNIKSNSTLDNIHVCSQWLIGIFSICNTTMNSMNLIYTTFGQLWSCATICNKLWVFIIKEVEPPHLVTFTCYVFLKDKSISVTLSYCTSCVSESNKSFYLILITDCLCSWKPQFSLDHCCLLWLNIIQSVITFDRKFIQVSLYLWERHMIPKGHQRSNLRWLCFSNFLRIAF